MEAVIVETFGSTVDWPDSGPTIPVRACGCDSDRSYVTKHRAAWTSHPEGRFDLQVADHAHREYVQAGGLMSYVPNLASQFPRAADYVDKILLGAKQSELPVDNRPIRIRRQCHNRQGDRPRNADESAGPRRRGDRMRACSFVSLFGAVAAAWSVAAHAQQSGQVGGDERHGSDLAESRTRAGKTCREHAFRSSIE
jgi:hypothetical protein